MSDPTDKVWHICRRGLRVGPVTTLELAWLAKAGDLKSTDHIWCRGLSDWIEAGAVPGLLPAAVPEPPTQVIPLPIRETPPHPIARLTAAHERLDLTAQDPFAKAAARLAQGRAAGPSTTAERESSGATPTLVSRMAGALSSSPTPQPRAGTDVAVRSATAPPADTTATAWGELGRFDLGKSLSEAIILTIDRLELYTLDDLTADWRLEALASDAVDILPGTVRFLVNQTIGRKVLEGAIIDMMGQMRARIPPEQRNRDLRDLVREMSASPWLRDRLSGVYDKTRTGISSLVASYTPSRLVPQGWWGAPASEPDTARLLSADIALLARTELL